MALGFIGRGILAVLAQGSLKTLELSEAHWENLLGRDKKRLMGDLGTT